MKFKLLKQKLTFFGAHKIVPVERLRYHVHRLAGVMRIDFVQPCAQTSYLVGTNENIRGGTLKQNIQ